MAAKDPTTFDYVICGGGLTGCVIASQLSQHGHSVALLEAGSEEYSDLIMSPVGAPRLLGSEWEFNFVSQPQAQLKERKIRNHAGRLLGGSSAVNYGLWTRGHGADYDEWADRVGDQRWNYEHLLPYFKQVESHHDANADASKFGFDGPISTTAGKRQYPLDQAIHDAFTQSGHAANLEANGGDPIGIAPFTENWKDARRQPASKAFDLSQANVFVESSVARIELSPQTKRAERVHLEDGRVFQATKEVILCCGALKTPQLLMLSGIGPAAELARHGIPMVMDLPVGANLHDHPSLSLFWKLREPEKGLALGSPLFNRPEYAHGNPARWLVTATLDADTLRAVATADTMEPQHPFLQRRAHAEIIPFYAPVSMSDFHPPMDGTHIATGILALLPTSRGRVTLADTSPASLPLIDPRYLTTEADRATLHFGIRAALRAMETAAGAAVVKGEAPPPGFEPLTSRSSDAELDRRLEADVSSFVQNAGTAEMGKVVDPECKVMGIRGLRVCDASILPVPIAGHYQAPMYAIALAAADMILSSSRT